jgi:hypothetical protein
MISQRMRQNDAVAPPLFRTAQRFGSERGLTNNGHPTSNRGSASSCLLSHSPNRQVRQILFGPMLRFARRTRQKRAKARGGWMLVAQHQYRRAKTGGRYRDFMLWRAPVLRRAKLIWCWGRRQISITGGCTPSIITLLLVSCIPDREGRDA